jgi:glycosyltransferase involved in cell wall biosynthesis
LEENQGLSFARNTGLKKAKGKIIAYIDDDAEASSQWLQELLNGYEHQKNVMSVGGKVEPIWDAPRPEWLDDSFLVQLSILKYSKGSRELVWPERLIGTNCSFRKEVFAKYGLFDTRFGRVGSCLIGGEEVELQQRIKETNDKIFYVDEAIVYHHVPASRMTRDYFEKKLEGHRFTKRIRELRKRNGYQEIEILMNHVRNKNRMTDAEREILSASDKLKKQGDIDKAKDLLKKLIVMEPSSVRARNTLGKLYREVGELKAALGQYISAIRIDPYDRETVIGCSELLRENKMNEHAKKLAASYLTFYPNDEEVNQLTSCEAVLE